MRKELVTGIISGVIIGAAVGMVLAPNSGKENRRNLMYQISRFRNRVASNASIRRLNPVAAHRAGEAN